MQASPERQGRRRHDHHRGQVRSHRFDNASHGRDLIAGFDAATDVIYIDRAGFKLNQPLGQIDPTRNRSGTTRQAGDAGDRFIVRTTDDTRRFGCDGNRGKVTPVPIAGSNRADIPASDITLF